MYNVMYKKIKFITWQPKCGQIYIDAEQEAVSGWLKIRGSVRLK